MKISYYICINKKLTHEKAVFSSKELIIWNFPTLFSLFNNINNFTVGIYYINKELTHGKTVVSSEELIICYFTTSYTQVNSKNNFTIYNYFSKLTSSDPQVKIIYKSINSCKVVIMIILTLNTKIIYYTYSK